MDAREELAALRRLAELEAKASAPARPLQAQAEDPGIAQTLLIGAGRTGDKVLAGMKQLGLSAMTAGREALGMDTGSQLRDLAALEQEQKARDSAYAGLQAQRPIATAVGEALPTIAIPVGQATAAARIAAPTIGMAAIEGAQYGSPMERLTKAGLGAATGLAGGAAGEAVARVIQPVRSAMASPAQNAARAAAAKIDAPLLPSQLTGSATLARVEDALARSPGSAGVMQDFIQQQKDALGAAAAKAIRQPSENSIPQVVQDAARAGMGAEYDAMRAQIPNGLPAGQPVFDAIDKALSRLSSGSQKSEGKASAINMLAELKDKLYSTRALTPEEYSSWVSDIASAARKNENDAAKAALKSVGAKMDEIARGPLNREWQKLDQSWAALRSLQKSGAVNPQTGDIAIGRLANYMQRHPSGANATPLADVAAFAQAVPQLRAGSQTFERSQVGMSGLLNSLWRYPLAKAMTSKGGAHYLANGALASPEASGLLAGIAQRGGLPATNPLMLGLLAPYLQY